MAVLRLPDAAARKFVAVDCGARGSSWPPHIRAAFPSANLLGFDPDADACRDFERDLAPNARAFCVAVGETDGTATIHLTHNPACSSLLAPDHMYFGRFADIGDAVTPIETKQVPVVRLDTFLVALDVHSADYMHLDVQGAELDVLRGARCLLETTLALQVEVEFSRIYHDQPLFADVDSFLRARGFALFGLERQAVLRRAVLPSEVPTRGQLMWAHAVICGLPPLSLPIRAGCSQAWHPRSATMIMPSRSRPICPTCVTRWGSIFAIYI